MPSRLGGRDAEREEARNDEDSTPGENHGTNGES